VTMSERGSKTQVSYFASTLGGALRDVYHQLAAAYWCIRLGVKRGDTKPTYKFCRHLDQTTYFRSQFRAFLEADPAREKRWLQRQVFIDYMPDYDKFKDYPEGTVGRAYYEMIQRHTQEGLLELRRRRLEVLPDEAAGLDLEALQKVNDLDERLERIIARRNIYMTSTHDFCHMLTGSHTDVAGEALVARYQYRHLLVPQNWVNMWLARIVYAISFRWKGLRVMRACFPSIDRSRSYTETDFDNIWSRPIQEFRRELKLPPEGYMPGDILPERAPIFDPQPA
jgi:ubiquinone biosynthesis protein Coq4